MHGVGALTFSPNDKTVASTGTVRLWGVMAGVALQVLEGHTLNINTLLFSPDNKRATSVSRDGMIRFWDAATGIALQALNGHMGNTRAIAVRRAVRQ
jgi:WD40 repeat protein